jgi:predicted DNA binding CopG/RHH family protein
MNAPKADDTYEIEDLGDTELPASLDLMVQSKIAAAEMDLEAARVNFRWQREPLDLVKNVAKAMGIPYQTYIKQVLYRQAMEDYGRINTIKAVEHKLTPSSMVQHLTAGVNLHSPSLLDLASSLRMTTKRDVFFDNFWTIRHSKDFGKV